MSRCAALFGLVRLVMPDDGPDPEPPAPPGLPVGGVLGRDDMDKVGVLRDTPDPILLSMSRTDRATGSPLAELPGYVEDPYGFACFNGAGLADLPEGRLSLARSGEGLTLAVRCWAFGGDAASDQPGDAPMAKPMAIIGLAGHYGVGAGQVAGTWLEIEDPGADPLVIRWRQAGVPSDLSLSGTAPDAEGQAGGVVGSVPLASTPDGVLLLVVTVARVNSLARLRVFVNGERIGDDVDVDPALFARRLVVGDLVESDGAWAEGALWTRPLEAIEIVGLGTDLGLLTACEGIVGGGGDVFPFLTDGGRSRLRPAYTVPRQTRAGLVVSDGARREVRAGDEESARAYTLVWTEDDGDDLDVILAAMAGSGFGAISLHWRHPEDDPPGPPSTAPRWRITNTDDLRPLAVQRARGAHVGRFSLELEEVL